MNSGPETHVKVCEFGVNSQDYSQVLAGPDGQAPLLGSGRELTGQLQ